METHDKPGDQPSQPLVQQVCTEDHGLAFQQVPGYALLALKPGSGWRMLFTGTQKLHPLLTWTHREMKMV